MADTKTEIETLLKRNVFLKPELKAKILASGESEQEDILPTLRAMDQEQTNTFRAALNRNPDLFEDWSNAIEIGTKNSG